MAQTEEHYRAAAHSLGEGFLGSQFGKSNLDQAEISKIHRIEAFRENAILLAGDHVEHMGVMALGAQAGKSNIAAQQKRSKEAKRSMDNLLFLNLLDAHIEELGRQMDAARDSLEEQYGEEWREVLALELLDPDEMPERREGESITAYRERLEPDLIDAIRDENGNIRPEIRDDPRYEHLVTLAETQDMETRAKAERDIQLDESIPLAERQASQERYLASTDAPESLEYQAMFEAGSSQDQAAREDVNASVDDTGRSSTVSISADNAFLA